MFRDGQGTSRRPNILLIVADDLGFADLGTFGSNIRTPVIDSLAARGTTFTQFHTAPMCAPSRAMLLSGNNNHVAGMARQSPHGPLQEYLPGYEGYLSARVAPLSELLRDGGYRTYMAGKWHLGSGAEHGPRSAGFQRSFVLVEGAANHWNAKGYSEEGSTYLEDGETVEWPVGIYSADLYTDKLIAYIEEGLNRKQPFFALAAYTSPHWPLQVPEDELDLYAGTFDEGYDILREKRLAALKARGIIPAPSPLPPRLTPVRPWTDLGPDERRLESRKMELYAAMVDNLDAHVGRLIDYLADSGQLQNTVIVFMSDNGAAGEDLYNMEPFSEYLQKTYDNRYENMGRPDSFVSYGAQWAEAGTAPFKGHKGYTSEGGIRAPLIIADPRTNRHGELSHAYVTIMDIAPTLLDLAGIAYPEGGGLKALLGCSLVPVIAGSIGDPHDDLYVTTMFHVGRAMLRRGNWKIIQNNRPFDEEKFELYDLSADPGEMHDLKSERLDVYSDLLELWRVQRESLGIVLPQDL